MEAHSSKRKSRPNTSPKRRSKQAKQAPSSSQGILQEYAETPAENSDSILYHSQVEAHSSKGETQKNISPRSKIKIAKQSPSTSQVILPGYAGSEAENMDIITAQPKMEAHSPKEIPPKISSKRGTKRAKPKPSKSEAERHKKYRERKKTKMRELEECIEYLKKNIKRLEDEIYVLKSRVMVDLTDDITV